MLSNVLDAILEVVSYVFLDFIPDVDIDASLHIIPEVVSNVIHKLSMMLSWVVSWIRYHRLYTSRTGPLSERHSDNVPVLTDGRMIGDDACEMSFGVSSVS